VFAAPQKAEAAITTFVNRFAVLASVPNIVVILADDWSYDVEAVRVAIG
jgi:hypothetical protein